jgi:glucose dehydrogenase
LDDHTVAVDAKTGKEVWRTKMGNVENGETMTMSPFVVGDKVFVGNSGGELGKIGWLAALGCDTRAKSCGARITPDPTQLVKIGEDFKPIYSWMKGKDLGVSTWPADMWKTAGGAAWGWISYDPVLHLIYYGSANPSPRVPVQRPGLNLWTSSVFARDPNTGEAKWAYSFTPHDQWDYDGVNENVLLELTIGGTPRKVMVQFNRNAYAYTIDRESGEVLVAAPFRLPELVERLRHEDRHGDRAPRQGAEAEREAARRLPPRHRRQGLATFRVFAEAPGFCMREFSTSAWT